jgi:heme exporter protein C
LTWANVFGAIRWWRTQHPAPVIMGGPNSGLDPIMKKVFFFNVLALHVLAAFFIVERYLLEKVKYDVEILKEETESR